MRTIIALLTFMITINDNYVFMLPFFHMYPIVELLLLNIYLEYIVHNSWLKLPGHNAKALLNIFKHCYIPGLYYPSKIFLFLRKN